ncbi:HD-GYP domain-containing protein [Hylemonella gracilis]|uniref:HD-GYP domain-containing protein n=1 Tax=Hylemonella gracilis TaxID=80880 RepID=A0A4P6ULV4_9BURK|nr:HD-GYP domain-containing protein [Hylemonella gracilis]QBK05105.1 HD-GYP domain-containing protein [Hylemonella gracilis]
MLKCIRVESLKMGMWVEELRGSWQEHPFWRDSFLLTDPKDLERILESSIREVWIDSSKGLDVPAGTEVETEEQAAFEAQLELNAAARPPLGTEPVPINEELSRAAQICQQSKQAVMSMFQEARMGKTVDAAQAQHLVEEISDSVSRNASALISLARLKTADDYTYMHSVAVCALMIALARQMGLSEAQTRSAGLAGLLHDLGKAVTPPQVLNKPGKLTPAEFDVMKKHTIDGYRMLQSVGNLDPVALDVCLHHHEKVDGSGYPEGLKDEEISLFAKMGAVCDVYDAITSDRPYKAGWDPAQSLHKMAEWSRGHFDHRVFQAFVKSLGIYPVGSLLRLSSDRWGAVLAVVIEQSPKALTKPVVKVFYSVDRTAHIAPQTVDLSSSNVIERIVGREDPVEWEFEGLDQFWAVA